MKVTFIPVVSGALGTVAEGLLKGREDISGYHPNNYSIENGKDTEK